MLHKKQTKSQTKKVFLILFVLALLVVAGLWFYHSRHEKTKLVTTAKTTSKLPTAQTTYTSGQPRSATSNTQSQGGATDNKGQAPTSSGSSQSSITSPSGDITLEQPTTNQLVSDGATIFGQAKVQTVQFRVIDNSSGVIAQGSLDVVNGSFSGTLHFKAYSTTGELNVFSIDPQTGAEINEISLPIKL
jgi:hypothetical protein